MNKKLTFLLSLTFLFLFSGSVYGQEEVKKEYWDNGKLWKETHYKNGEKVLEIRWFMSHKQKSLEYHYKNGKRHGRHTNWRKTGKKHFVFNFENGEREGSQTFWYESGVKEEETYYLLL
jgi:antitoxin component YwqK of YwqJK toxin-antitoxin module